MKNQGRMLAVGVLLSAGFALAQSSSSGGYYDPNNTPAPSSSNLDASAPPPTQPVSPPPAYVPPPPPADVPVAYAAPPRVADKWADMRGVTLMVGGGVEGFTGNLATRVKAGPTWDAIIVFKPTSVLGLELGYTGSYNGFNTNRLVGYDPSVGASVQRNGGHFALTVGLSATRVQPYLLAGIGVDRYSVRGAGPGGYSSVTDGEVPVGGGVRAYLPGGFTMDLRGTYDLVFGNTFASNVQSGNALGVATPFGANSFRASFNLGYTF